jgi:hypothetical protein
MRSCVQEPIVLIDPAEAPEEHGVRYAEHRRIDPDTDSKRRHGHRRESGAPAQGAEGIASVLDERFDESQSPLIAVHLLHLIDTPKLASCRQACFQRQLSAALVFVREAVEMDLNLVLELRLATAPAEESTHARQEDSDPRHRSSCSSVPIGIVMVRAQLFMPQCREWVDSRCPRCRSVAGHTQRGDEYSTRQHDCERINGFDAEQKELDGWHGAPRTDEADDEPSAAK